MDNIPGLITSWKHHCSNHLETPLTLPVPSIQPVLPFFLEQKYSLENIAEIFGWIKGSLYSEDAAHTPKCFSPVGEQDSSAVHGIICDAKFKFVTFSWFCAHHATKEMEHFDRLTSACIEVGEYNCRYTLRVMTLLRNITIGTI